jgi:hypothetical protein
MKAVILDASDVVVDIRAPGDGVGRFVLAPDHITFGDTTPDNGATFYRNGELVVPALVPVTKLDIKSRVTPSEWAALKAAIATDPDAAENWELANSIDPDHPQTKQVIAYLQANGALTTPLWEVFR